MTTDESILQGEFGLIWDKSIDGSVISNSQKEKARVQLNLLQDEVDYTTKEYTVEFLVYKITKGDLFCPPYQRNFIWDFERKCRFIETLLLGLPIPYVFLSENKDGRMEVIDGWQRLSSCNEFLKDQLVVAALERLDELDGFKFSDLPDEHKRRFLNRSIRTIVLGKNVPESDKQDIFYRINTGSVTALPVEVRRGALPGRFSGFVEELAKDDLFNKLCPMTQRMIDLRQREEVIGRFFAYGDGLEQGSLKYEDKPKDFLYDYTEKMNDVFLSDANMAVSYRERFNSVMSFVDRNFKNGFRKTAGAKSTPKVRFEAIAVGVYNALRQSPGLNSPAVLIDSWIDGKDFEYHTTSSAANTRRRLRERIDYVKRMILGEDATDLKRVS